GAMWMLATLILTPILRKGDAKIRSVNPAAMAIVPAAALIGAFSCLGLPELPKSGTHVLSFVVSAAVMGLCLLLAKKLGKSWLREWGLGFSIVIGFFFDHLRRGPGLRAPPPRPPPRPPAPDH